jgi:6-phosphogluconolactonase (cycloisomerase 2 family)
LFSAAQKSDQLERAAAPQISPTSNDLQKAARTWREQEKRCYVALSNRSSVVAFVPQTT